MSGRLSALGLPLLLLFLAACNQAAPPELTAPQLEPALPQLAPQATSQTFSATGTEQTFTVPAGVTSVTVEARGAPGGTGRLFAWPGGRGAVVTTELAVTPGQTLYLNVGGAPTTVSGGCYPNTDCIGGFNGGGSSYYGAGGGGASDVRLVSRTAASGSLESRLLIAAGGGGGGFTGNCSNGGTGGDAGSAGKTSDPCEGAGIGGGAGTQSAGGAGGSSDGASGSLGQGGNGGRGDGGGGGGGTFRDRAMSAGAGGGGGGSSLDPDGGTLTLDDARTPQITVSYTRQDQTVSFTSTAPTDAKVGGSYTPSATATSGLSVTFGTSTSTTCTFAEGTVSFIAAGECTVTADQTGDSTYTPATQVTQSFTISLPPVLTDTYTVDFETAPLNTILYNVKVGQGVVYSGTGTANTDPIRVDGYRYLNGNRLGSNQAKVLKMAGDKILTVVKAGTNTPNPSGGELDVKPTESFGGPTLGKNGRVTLKSVTVNGVSTNGAKLILYGDSKVIQAIALRKTPTQTLALSVSGVAVIHVRANDSFTVDDVVFEVPSAR